MQCGEWTPLTDKQLPSINLPHTFPSGNPTWRELYPLTHNSYPPNYLMHFPQEIQRGEWTPLTSKRLPSTRLPHTFPSGNPAQRARPCVTEQRAAPPSRPWPPEGDNLGPVADSTPPSAAPLGGQDRWRGAGTCRSAGSPASRRWWAGQRSTAQRRQLRVGEILSTLASQMDHQSVGEILSTLAGQMDHQSVGEILSTLASQMDHQSVGEILSTLAGQMDHQSVGEILSTLASQMDHQSVGEILSTLASQMDHQSVDFTCSFSKSSNEWMDK